MNNETYLDKARTNLTTAILVYKGLESDEGLINMVGYHLQQAFELTMKHILFINGVEFSKTHRIEELYEMLSANNLINAYFKDDWIDEHAEQLTSWEANTRHILNLRLEKRKVDIAMPIITEFVRSDRVEKVVE